MVVFSCPTTNTIASVYKSNDMYESRLVNHLLSLCFVWIEFAAILIDWWVEMTKERRKDNVHILSLYCS